MAVSVTGPMTTLGGPVMPGTPYPVQGSRLLNTLNEHCFTVNDNNYTPK